MTLFRTALLVFVSTSLYAATTGSISGTVTDPAGAVLPGAMVSVTNQAQGIQNKTTTDAKGTYSFPILPVGKYDLKVEAASFKTHTQSGLTVDIDSALKV